MRDWHQLGPLSGKAVRSITKDVSQKYDTYVRSCQLSIVDKAVSNSS